MELLVIFFPSRKKRPLNNSLWRVGRFAKLDNLCRNVVMVGSIRSSVKSSFLAVPLFSQQCFFPLHPQPCFPLFSFSTSQPCSSLDFFSQRKTCKEEVEGSTTLKKEKEKSTILPILQPNLSSFQLFNRNLFSSPLLFLAPFCKSISQTQFNFKVGKVRKKKFRRNFLYGYQF